MSYKTDQAKAIKILRCLTPPRVLVNGPPMVDMSEFVRELGGDGFNAVLAHGDDASRQRIGKIWKRKGSGSTLVAGCIPEGWMLDGNEKIFNGSYSYVFLYINNPQEYAKLVMNFIKSSSPPPAGLDAETRRLITEARAPGADIAGLARRLVAELLKSNRETYQRHCDIFEERILTVLL
jgi:hypothetical protein